MSTVYRELHRGMYKRMTSDLVMVPAYSADIAQKDYDYKSTNKGADLKISNDFELVAYIEQKIIEEQYSPAAVLGEIRETGKEFKTTICTKTLYNYIDKQVFLNVTNEHLLRKRFKKQKYDKVHIRTKKPLCQSIEERPKSIETREDFGHWEMDTVIGKAKGKGQVLLVLTERKTREEIISRLNGKTMDDVVTFLNRLEQKYNNRFSQIFKTITVDNGSEFMDYDGMRKSCISEGDRTKLYYCHPNSSWERGSNENANSIIRRFIPKGTPIENYTDEQIAYVEHWMNNYPRKLHNFQCTHKLFVDELKAVC